MDKTLLINILFETPKLILLRFFYSQGRFYTFWLFYVLSLIPTFLFDIRFADVWQSEAEISIKCWIATQPCPLVRIEQPATNGTFFS